MSTESFHRESGGLGRVRPSRNADSEIRPAIGAKRADSCGFLAETACSVLAGAAIPVTYKLTVETPEGPIVVGINPNGNPLEQLAHACFQGPLEAALARYLDSLEKLKKGQRFPGMQLPDP